MKRLEIKPGTICEIVKTPPGHRRQWLGRYCTALTVPTYRVGPDPTGKVWRDWYVDIDAPWLPPPVPGCRWVAMPDALRPISDPDLDLSKEDPIDAP